VGSRSCRPFAAWDVGETPFTTALLVGGGRLDRSSGVIGGSAITPAAPRPSGWCRSDHLTEANVASSSKTRPVANSEGRCEVGFLARFARSGALASGEHDGTPKTPKDGRKTECDTAGSAEKSHTKHKVNKGTEKNDSALYSLLGVLCEIVPLWWNSSVSYNAVRYRSERHDSTRKARTGSAHAAPRRTRPNARSAATIDRRTGPRAFSAADLLDSASSRNQRRPLAKAANFRAENARRERHGRLASAAPSRPPGSACPARAVVEAGSWMDRLHGANLYTNALRDRHGPLPGRSNLPGPRTARKPGHSHLRHHLRLRETC